MKRQRIKNQNSDIEYKEISNSFSDDTNRGFPMQNHRPRREHVLEAQIQDGDTLQAIALRFNCTIADIKRLNKIEKEIEIHARKIIKVPANAHSMLLITQDDLPIVHKSGQSSPKQTNQDSNSTSRNELLTNNRHKLDEKLLVASVSLSSPTSTTSQGPNINDIILNSDLIKRNYSDNGNDRSNFSINDPLLDDDENERAFYDGDNVNIGFRDGRRRLRSGPHAIRGAPKNDLSCSGSDCDISWICLLFCILALCFAIPLIYVIYVAEHPDEFRHNESENFNIG